MALADLHLMKRVCLSLNQSVKGITLASQKYQARSAVVPIINMIPQSNVCLYYT